MFERLHGASLKAAHAKGATEWTFLAVDGCHEGAAVVHAKRDPSGATGASKGRTERPWLTAAGLLSHSP